jgi:hypothetical protein
VIECPEDMPAPFDFDAEARAADLANDAAAVGFVPSYQHRPVSTTDLRRAIYGNQSLIDCGAMTSRGGSK